MSGEVRCARSFLGTDKRNTQVTSPLGNEEELFIAKKVVVGSLRMGVGGVIVSEGMSKFTV